MGRQWKRNRGCVCCVRWRERALAAGLPSYLHVLPVTAVYGSVPCDAGAEHVGISSR